MKATKKLMSLLLVLVMLFACVGCGGNTGNADDAADNGGNAANSGQTQMDAGDTDEEAQLYLLWSHSQRWRVERLCQNAEHLESLRPEGPDGRFAWVYCLLLDADYQPVAYTILTNEGAAS